ncbi:polysaccharide deacetylase family protein [Halorussus sp. AFM4]|uniref:polysaccharide deacetylase family protein n=1 Tax=Halorussus sp. AFM4 TaxID=3421651 RepID=UPI003EBC4D75
MTVYLTVDDAPSADLPEKLDLLADREVPALFFCEGRRLADHPEHARRAVEAGFHLGNHAYSHTSAADLSVAAFRDEVERTESLIRDAYDRAGATRPAKLFRFPYGEKGGEDADAFQRVLADRRFVPPDPDRLGDRYADRHAGDRDWYWTVDLRDWEVDSPDELRDRVDSAAERLDGESSTIVLFHDAGNSTELFEAFLDALDDQGVDFGDPLDLLD